MLRGSNHGGIAYISDSVVPLSFTGNQLQIFTRDLVDCVRSRNLLAGWPEFHMALPYHPRALSEICRPAMILKVAQKKILDTRSCCFVLISVFS